MTRPTRDRRKALLRRALLVVGFVKLCALIVSAGAFETGFLDRTVILGGIEYRYQVYVPRGFGRTEKWPVIVALHGGGEYGSDGMRQTNVGMAPAIRRDPDRFRAIVVFPQAKADGRPGWQLESGRAAMAALDNALKEFSGDPARVVLTGYSAGGNGTWFLASRYKERFAAIVPVCAFVSEFLGRSTRVLYPALAPGPDPHAEIAKKVAGIPVWMFHGARDDVVLPDESRKMHHALKNLGADVRYTELPEANHNAWDPAYGNKELIEWMLKQRRPERSLTRKRSTPSAAGLELRPVQSQLAACPLGCSRRVHSTRASSIFLMNSRV